MKITTPLPISRKRKPAALVSLIFVSPIFVSLILLIPCALQAETKTLVASGTITVTQEKGRAVFSNDGASATPAKTLKNKPLAANFTATYNADEYLAPQPKLMFWSNTEHRYKPVPRATPMAMRAAKSAVAEVEGSVSPNLIFAPGISPKTSLIGSSATPQEVDSAIEQAARRHNVDANLVRALIHVESNFNSKAVSRKGAMGLMQLMPSTARQLKVTNPFDPDQNVDAGVRHLKQLLQDFNGNVKLSLAAYNAGAGAVHRSAGIPNYAETRNYVSRITSLYNSGDNSPFRGVIGAHYGSQYEPMRISRDSQGVLTVTNTE